jgi:hypothetical protein
MSTFTNAVLRSGVMARFVAERAGSGRDRMDVTPTILRSMVGWDEGGVRRSRLRHSTTVT